MSSSFHTMRDIGFWVVFLLFNISRLDIESDPSAFKGLKKAGHDFLKYFLVLFEGKIYKEYKVGTVNFRIYQYHF